MDDALLDPDEACKVLHIAKPTLYQLSSRGAIRKVKIGSCLRFRRVDLLEFMDQNTVEPIEPVVV